jgi:hypothetical protein
VESWSDPHALSTTDTEAAASARRHPMGRRIITPGC